MSDAATSRKVADALEEARRREVHRRWMMLTPALIVLLVGASGPLLIVLVYSFLTPGDYGGVVWNFSTEAWAGVVVERDIFSGALSFADAHLMIFWRSLRISLLTTIICIGFGFPTAWFIATRPPRYRNVWLFLITIPFWTNLLIRTFAIMQLISNHGLINNTLMGLGLISRPIEMLYTDFSILLGMAYVYFPLMVLPLYASMEKLDFRLVEAAYDLYASRRRVLLKVVVPLVTPGIVAGSILVFVPSLGAYVTPRVLGGGKHLMLGNLIALQFGQGRDWPLGASLSMTLLALVMVALLFYVRAAQRGSGRG